MERLSLRHPGTRIVNGELGVWSNTTSPRKTLFNQLWDQGALLNPVIGLRTDQVNPKMTIGALDQNDYVGTINWIEIRGTCAHTSPGEAEGGHTGCEDWREDGFIIDGLKGYNGSFIPFDTSEITATLSTFAKDILVPPEFLARYFSDPGYHEPNMTSALTFNCYGSEPGPPFAITINGVDYPLKSYWFRLFRINPGLCRVGMSNVANSKNGF
ncbi:hypothetical protein AX16_002506 [Volvariella volvacea WC 439]|nr:hypothetical protein AX16_002506 [Volvariella volvacea WC 439]